MSQQIETSGQEVASLAAATAVLDNIFGGPESAPAESAPAPEAAAPQEAPPPAAAEAKVPEAPGSLAELIRTQRQDRAARIAKEAANADLSSRLAAAESTIARMGKADLVGDPVGFAQLHGLTEQEMALVGQAYLYHLVPDKAPPDLRYKMLEAKTARDARAREASQAQQHQAQVDSQQTAQVQQYTAALSATVQVWETGGAAHPFPESSAWFGGNHDEYAESLTHTARNIAEGARERGEVADLSPKAVAAALEQDIGSRAKRFRTPAAAPSQQSEKAAEQAPAGKQPAVMSTKGQGASPMPKAVTEEERIQRAIAAAFNSR